MSKEKEFESGPALFAPIEGEWLIRARNHFSAGKDLLYFSTRSKNIPGRARAKDIRHVYFKKKGQSAITMRGDFKELTKHPPLAMRLPGAKPIKGRVYFYAFCNLMPITRIPISELRRYGTETTLRNDVPGACIIKEPRAVAPDSAEKPSTTERLLAEGEIVSLEPISNKE